MGRAIRLIQTIAATASARPAATAQSPLTGNEDGTGNSQRVSAQSVARCSNHDHPDRNGPCRGPSMTHRDGASDPTNGRRPRASGSRRAWPCSRRRRRRRSRALHEAFPG
jgi:hypothetical protein